MGQEALKSICRHSSCSYSFRTAHPAHHPISHFAAPLLYIRTGLSRKCAMTASEANVLIADDEPAIAAFVQRALELMGLLAVVATDGAAAIKLPEILQASLDCVILDRMMHAVNGLGS